MNSLSKVPDSVIHGKKKTQKTAFLVFPKYSQCFCVRTYHSHFGMRFACTKDRNMQICSQKCSTHAQRHEAEVSLKFPKENIASMKLQAKKIFGIRAPSVKTFHE